MTAPDAMRAMMFARFGLLNEDGFPVVPNSAQLDAMFMEITRLTQIETAARQFKDFYENTDDANAIGWALGEFFHILTPDGGAAHE